MKLTTKLIKIASNIPSWANIVNIRDSSSPSGFVAGWWTSLFDEPIFILQKNDVIWLPKSLRGKNPGEVLSEDIKSLEKEDRGKTHYNDWYNGFKEEQGFSKLWNGYQFTSLGLAYISKLEKFYLKNKLNNVEILNLDPKYSVNMELFQKLINANTLTRAIRVGRSLAKRYKIILELLKAAKKYRLVSRLERDFHTIWPKLNPIFSFDVSSYNPAIDTENDIDDNNEESLSSMALSFIKESEPLLDPQMGSFIQILEEFNHATHQGNEGMSKSLYEEMSKNLLEYIGKFGHHSLGINAQNILQLPSFISLHNKLFGQEKIT